MGSKMAIKRFYHCFNYGPVFSFFVVEIIRYDILLQIRFATLKKKKILKKIKIEKRDSLFRHVPSLGLFLSINIQIIKK